MPEPNHTPEDHELLQRFYGGSEGVSEPAFDALMARWRPRLRGIFHRCGFGGDEAEDLVQEVAIRIYLTRERKTIDLGQPFGPYVRAVARNLAAREMLRKRRLAPLMCEIRDEEAQEAPEPAPPDFALEDIYEAFKLLSDLEQSYLLLCRQHGLGELSHGEIAVALGKSPQYITLVSKRTIGRLRKQLERKGYRIRNDENAERD
ncbi:MAG: polymerase subunit sigma-24 [Armatimonadetes bacterium]|jgi:RNA polymerase sigma factor (sigma-70 family)|nr:polymerase subunit sigma-24 [Armatimonadota bacterium]